MTDTAQQLTTTQSLALFRMRGGRTYRRAIPAGSAIRVTPRGDGATLWHVQYDGQWYTGVPRVIMARTR